MTRWRRRGLLTRWEVAIGLLLAAATAAWLQPMVLRATWRTRRAEAEMVLATLVDHEIAAHRATGRWIPLAPFPRAVDTVGKAGVAWAGAPAGWTPPLDTARCAYASSGSGDAFRLLATCDVDGDGQPARYAVRPGEVVEHLTAEGVY